MNSKGVSLVELLIVIVLLSIVASISIFAVGQIVNNTQMQSIEANLIRLEDSVRLFRLSENDFSEDHRASEAIPDSGPISNEAWEAYGQEVLGDYVESWPTLPNSGIFSYRYRDDATNPSNPGFAQTIDRLHQITLNALDDDSYEDSMRDALFNGITPPSNGHFLMIRFNEDDEGDEDFIETATFLLENTEYQIIFRWVTANDNAQNNIWIYLD